MKLADIFTKVIEFLAAGGVMYIGCVKIMDHTFPSPITLESLYEFILLCIVLDYGIKLFNMALDTNKESKE